MSNNTHPPSASDTLYEIDSIVRVTVERLSGTDFVPPSSNPVDGVLSKDITIDPNRNISARLFLPKNAAVSHKLPLLLYIHGGAFFTESPFSPTYHNHLNTLVAHANVIAVSINYRLAPEHLLPTAYEDSWIALKWVFSHLGGNGNEAWLKNHADFKRVYLGGDSAGANIAHNMCIRVGLEKGIMIRVHGMFINCPYFWGSKRIGKESTNQWSSWVESIWIHGYPDSTGFDDPLLNPGMDPNLRKLGCKKVLVYVASEDVLCDRGWLYEKVLKESKWDGVVKVKEVMGEGHVFYLYSPDTPKAKEVVKQLAMFLNDTPSDQ